jgi:hypothetical protein
MIWAIWLRKLYVTLISRSSGFEPKLVHVQFVMDKVVLEEIFVRVVTSMLHTQSVTNHRPFTNLAIDNVIKYHI